jgi:hypothetical protein
MAALAAFAILAAVLIAVLVSDGTTIADQPRESALSQRDLAPTVRPGETDVIVLDMAGLGTPTAPSTEPNDPGTRPRETDVIVLDLAGLEATGDADASTLRDPPGLMIPQ